MMCWSFEASVLLSIIGLVVTLYLAFKKRSKFLWIPIGYFFLMEALQALQYLFLNDCSSPANQLLTLLGYLHIVFQPFFINMIIMYFIPDKVRIKIQGWVYAFCFIGAILMLISLYPFDWAGSCRIGVNSMCGENICTTSGNWHLAWSIPFNGMSNLGILGSLIPAFLIPLIYGAWKPVLYHFLLGPFLSSLLTSNINEQPAVWCLLSIAFLVMVFIKPIREWLVTKRWYFWKYPFK